MTALSTAPTVRRLAAAEEILAEILEGAPSEARFRRLVDLYCQPLCRFFARRGFSPEDCRDLTQEVFLGIYSGIGSFRREAGFETWMWKIATNAYRKRRRWRTAAKRAGPEVPLEETVEAAEASVASASSEDEILERERADLLSEAIRGLPDQMRKCLMLRVYQDLKYREIAVTMGLSTETVKAHLFQARRKLQHELGNYFADALRGIEEP